MSADTLPRRLVSVLPRRLVSVAALAALAALLNTPPVRGQELRSQNASASQAPTPPPAVAFFESQDPIEVVFTTNIGRIRGDKGDERPWRPATIEYKDSSGKAVNVPLKARTRGIWRLKRCDYPPMRLNFSGETSKGSIFHHLDKPKLVSYCQDRDSYEQYILAEFQLYRVYQLLTPMSHKARLLKFVYADSGSGKVRAKRYGFIMEEPSAMAQRLGGEVKDQKGALPGDLDPYQDALFGVFQYMIGNTDFSSYALHNVDLFFKPDGVVAPIAYDFDFAGVVDAGYAIPDEKLGIPTVRQRLFRGYCAGPAEFDRVFALFQEKKSAIYALYSDPIGQLLDRGGVKSTLKYYDEFYDIIGNPRTAKRLIADACIARPR